jgi:hypothetical protein
VILQLLVPDMLAVHPALIGVLGFVSIGQHHVISDLLLCKVRIGSRSSTLAMGACPDVLFASLGHGYLLP